MSKSRGAIKMLMELTPKEALVRENGKEVILPVEEVRVSDHIIIRLEKRFHWMER